MSNARPLVALRILVVLAVVLGPLMLPILAFAEDDPFDDTAEIPETPSCEQTGEESLSADADTYAPGATVVLAGAGYASPCEVTVHVALLDQSVSEETVTTAEGELHHMVAVDDEGWYFVGAFVGDLMVTSTTFTVAGTEGTLEQDVDLPTLEADDPCAPTGDETVATDEEDYPPGSTVTITGAGYAPECDVVIQIMRPDDVMETVATTTGADGSLLAYYLLPPHPGVIGEYGIAVIGSTGVELASMTFTDAAARVEIAPAYYPNAPGVKRDFSVLVRVTSALTSGNIGASCVRLTLPSGYAVEAADVTYAVGGGGPFALNVTATTMTLTAANNAGVPQNSWARFDFKATTPSNNISAWNALVADQNNCSTGANTAQGSARIGSAGNLVYAADLRDSTGAVIATPPVAEVGVPAVYRVRIHNTSGSSGAKIEYALVALPTCFTAPTAVSVTTSNAGFADFSVAVADNFLRLFNGELEKQNPTHFVQVQFSTAPTAGCAAGAHPFWTSAWNNSEVANAGDKAFATETHPTAEIGGAADPDGPDLTATKSNDTAADEVTAGDTFTWTILVENEGDDEAGFAHGDVILLDELPSGPTYGAVSVLNATGVTGTIDCQITGNDLVCEADGAVTMGDGGSFEVAFEVTTSSADIGDLDNPRSDGVCAVDPDEVVEESDEENNDCDDTVTVLAVGPDLTATKTNDTDDVTGVGQTFTWTIEVENEGDADADFATTEVVLLDQLPIGPTYDNLDWDDSGVTGTVSCAIANDVLTCSADGAVTFEPGAVLAVWFDVTPDEIGELDNPRSGGFCSADPGDKVDESDEENNDCADGVVVLPDLPGIVVTRGSCTFDLYDDVTEPERQFRLIFTPGSTTTVYKLNASNPGQMFVNVFYTGEEGEVDIELPYPFVTVGATPVHVHDALPSVSTNAKTCYGPNGSGTGQQTTVGLSDYDEQEFGETATLTVDVPEGFSHIRVHVAYGLKNELTGCTRDSVDATGCTGPVADLSNNQGYLFEALADGSTIGAETISSQNVFKRNPGIGGSLLFAQGGDPADGTTIEIWLDGKRVGTTKTDDDGWYLSEFKHKGKAATYTVKAPAFGLQKSADVKANGFVVVDFHVGGILEEEEQPEPDPPSLDPSDGEAKDPPPVFCQPKGKGNACK